MTTPLMKPKFAKKPRRSPAYNWILILIINMFLAAGSQAQLTSPSLTNSAEFLPVEQAYQVLPLIDGQGVSLDWRISDGYYLYKERFQLQARQGDKLLPLKTQWPAGIEKYDEYFEQELTVYYQGLLLNTDSALDTRQDFTLELRSQGCADAGLCYPPRDQTFAYRAATGEFTEQAPSLPAAPALAPAPVVQTDYASWLPALLAALIGGAILNLMPCVFPVLSIKALNLAASGEDAAHRRQHGWAYTAGVVLSFVAMAAALLLVRAGGQSVGWGFQLQSPGLILALVYLFFVLGMALLGALEIGAGLANIGTSLANKSGLKGSFFTGALATLVASPCTAPFMGTALGYAMTQPAAVSLSVFAALGLGMALPFLALAHLPGLHRWLPKPGPWMVTFKEILAFPLFITAVWLLWVLGRQTSSDQLVLALCGLVALGFAIWVWRYRHWLTWSAAALAVAFAILAPLHQPAKDEGWTDYKAAEWQQLRNGGQPVFVNVTADWCLTCLANEKLVFSRRDIQLAIIDAELLMVKADWTRYNPEITELLARYQRSGVPLYLMFPADPAAQPEILPQLLTPDLFKAALSRAIADN